MFWRRSALSAKVAPEPEPDFSPPPAVDLGDGPHGDLYCRALQRIQKAPALSILELGTRHTPGHRRTVRRAWAHPKSEYIGCDFQEGGDVDVVADGHELSKVFGENRFDVVLSCSVHEHFSRPWLATNEIGKVLKPGGWVYIQTHQTFPLHGYPHDYFRFSKEALELLCMDAGLKVIESAYQFPCRIVSDECGTQEPCYLNVSVLAEK